MLPSLRLIVPSSDALTSPAALGAALVWSIGQADAQAPAHADRLGWSFSNRYKVRPLASTRIVPTLELAVLTIATPDCPLPPEAVPGEPCTPPPEPPELLEPEPLLPQPAASTPTAASAASATSGRRSRPGLLGGGLLVPFQMRTCVPSFAGPGPCLVVHQLLLGTVSGRPCPDDGAPAGWGRRGHPPTS